MAQDTTQDELQRLLAESCAASGVPVLVEDSGTLAQVAAMLKQQVVEP